MQRQLGGVPEPSATTQRATQNTKVVPGTVKLQKTGSFADVQ